MLKIRQADEQTQTLVVQLTATSQPKSYEGLQAFFCAKLGQSIGLGIIEQKLEQSEMTDPKAGQLEYTFRNEDWQQIGRQVGYFSFRKMKDDGHEYVEQFTTRDFYFNVTKNVFSEGLTEVKKDGSTYVWTIEDLIRLFNEYIASGKSDWEEFVDQNREVLESVDPGGLILSELIRSRKPEGAEAPYPDLPTRLDEQIGKNSEFRDFESEKSFMKRVFNESVERGLNARWFGAIGDGLTDDTESIQKMFDDIPEYSTVFFGRSKTYRITKPINVNKNGLTIDFNQSTIIYDSDADLGDINGSLRQEGAFNIKGSLTDTTSVLTNLDNQNAIWFDNLNKNPQFYPSNATTFNVAEPEKFDVNDLVLVEYYNYGDPNVWDKTRNDNPTGVKIVCRIVSKMDDLITVDFKDDFVYDSSDQIGRITKIDSVKDVKIKNYNFEDVADRTNFPTELPFLPECRNSWVSGLSLEYVENIEISNMNAKHVLFACIKADSCYKIKLEKLDFRDARIKSAGCGYGIQLLYCNKITANDVNGDNLRHLIDLSGSGHARIANSGSNSISPACFDLHGLREFDVIYDNCNGTWVIGNGIAEFPCITGRVRIINSMINLTGGDGGIMWCSALDIINSKLTLSWGIRIAAASINWIGNEIMLNRNDTRGAIIESNGRGGIYKFASNASLADCIIIYDDRNGKAFNRNMQIIGFKACKISGCQFINKQVRFYEANAFAGIELSNHMIQISDSIFENMGLVLNGNLKGLDENYSLLGVRRLAVSNTRFTFDTLPSGHVDGSAYNMINITNFYDTFGAARLSVVATFDNCTFETSLTERTRWIRTEMINSPAKIYVDKSMFIGGKIEKAINDTYQTIELSGGKNIFGANVNVTNTI